MCSIRSHAMKHKIINTCLSCGYKWIREVFRPLRCPECRTRKWDREPVDKSKKLPVVIDVLPGEVKAYVFDKRTKRILKKAMRLNGWLTAEIRGDVVLVRNGKP